MIHDDFPYWNGCFMVCDVPNLNNRVYSSKIMEKAIEELKTREIVSVYLFPDGFTDAKNAFNLSLSDSSANVVGLWMDENEAYVQIQMFNNSKGKELFEALHSGNYVIRPCGSGSVNKIGELYYIGEDYQISNFSIIPKSVAA